MFWIPMAIGAAAGALTNRDNPLKGAAIGGTLGAFTGGLGGLGGAAAGGAGSAIAGAAAPAAVGATTVGGALTGAAGGTGLGLSLTPASALGAAPNLAAMGGGQGLLVGGMGAGTASQGGSIFSAGNLKTMSDMAGLAAKAGVFDGHQGPAAQSAGIPAQRPDFTGLLSAGRGQSMTGAQQLMAQRQARRG
jgi:hypothetical protein